MKKQIVSIFIYGALVSSNTFAAPFPSGLIKDNNGSPSITTNKPARNTSNSSVAIMNSTLNNTVMLKNSKIDGNVGIKVKANKVKISNSTLINRFTAKNSTLNGNGGISVGTD